MASAPTSALVTQITCPELPWSPGWRCHLVTPTCGPAKRAAWPSWDTTPPPAPQPLISAKDHSWSQSPVACGAGHVPNSSFVLLLLPRCRDSGFEASQKHQLSVSVATEQGFLPLCPGASFPRLPGQAFIHQDPLHSGAHPSGRAASLLKPLGISLLPSRSNPAFHLLPEASPRDRVSFQARLLHLLTQQPHLGSASAWARLRETEGVLISLHTPPPLAGRLSGFSCSSFKSPWTGTPSRSPLTTGFG